ncbi:MAG TPA: hypothetical protein VK943_13060, partial [Arenibaculum sp.]|nr:hypothetical protein [Arenibaculum sp.]
MRSDAAAGAGPWTGGDDGRRAAALRALPQVHKAMELPAAHALLARFPRSRVLAAVRGRLDEVRRALLAGQVPDPFSEAAFFADVRDGLERERLSGLRRVVNATGIVIHTNLGRAPLAPAAIEAVVQAALGYSSLELDLETGRRGSRGTAVQSLLRALTGAEAALVVNN